LELSIGDYERIPPYSFDKGYMGRKEALVTDYYYMDLAGKYPWEIHFPPDIISGRIWAENFDEAKERLEAILDYENKSQFNYPASFCGGFMPMFDDGWGLKDPSYLGEELKKATKEKIKSDGWLDSQLLYLFDGLLKKGSIGENITRQMTTFYSDFGCFNTSSTCYLRTIHDNLMGMQLFGDPAMELPDLKLSEIS